MKNISDTKEAGRILVDGGFRFFRPERLTHIKAEGELFEFRLNRGLDITQTKDTIAHQIIEAAKSQNCIAGIAKAYDRIVVGEPENNVIIIQFTLEQKDFWVGQDVEILLYDEVVAYGTVEEVGIRLLRVVSDGGVK